MGLAFDVYAAANPNGAPLATLADAFGKQVSLALRGVGAGQFSIPRSSPQATAATLAQGNLVKVRLTDLSASPIGAFWMETGRFDLVGNADAPEVLTFGGPGARAYLNRAVMWSQSFVAGEPDPVDNEWHLADGAQGSRAGTILRRLLLESTHASRPQQPLPSLAFGTFSNTSDSDGNTWNTTPGTAGLLAHVGDYLDVVVASLLEATDTLVVQVDPYLELRAYNSFGVDRTSPTLAPDKVRLEKGINLASALAREFAGPRIKSHILAAGDPGSFASAGSAITPVREGFVSSSGIDLDGLAALAEAQISIVGTNAESISLGIPYGDDPTVAGSYRPGPIDLGGHYWLGDTITIHTGTGSHDLNESPQVIAEITIAEDESGAPVCTVSLGSTYSGSLFAVINDTIRETRSDVSAATNTAVRVAYSLSHPRVVDVLPTLPDSTYPIGTQVFLTTDEKIYRNPDNVAWTAAIEAVDLTGQIDETQISDDSIATPMLKVGSVQADQIAVNAIQAGHLDVDSVTAGTVATGAISAEALAAEIILAKTLLATAVSGRRVEIDTFGIRNYGADEKILVNIPTVGTDPVSVVGAIEASSLVSTASAELRGVNSLPGGSVTELQVGVTDPTTAPVIGSSLAYTSLAAPQNAGHGLTYDSTGDAGGATPTYWVGANPTVGNKLDLAYEYDAATGVLLRILRKTGTTVVGTATLGSTNHVSASAEASSGSLNSQIARELTMPRDGTITKVSAYLAGYNGSANIKNAIWQTNGNLLSSSSAYTAASRTFSAGNSDHYNKNVPDQFLAEGTTFWAGFLRTSAGDGFQWDRSNNSPTKKGDGLGGNFDLTGTDNSHRPNIYVTYEYLVDSSVEGAVTKIVGVARQGNYIWVLDSSGMLYRYLQVDLTYVSKHDLASRINGTPANAGLFFDGTYLVITTASGQGSSAPPDFVRVTTAGAWSSTLTASGVTMNGSTGTIRGGRVVSGLYWVAVNSPDLAGPVGVYAFNATTGALVADRNFGTASETSSGVTFDDVNFRAWSSGAAATKLYRFTDWDWTTESDRYWIAYTWYDSVATVHESGVSPRADLVLGRRRRLTISTPAMPSGYAESPDNVRVYLARAASDPGTGASYARQVEDATQSRTLVDFDSGGAANPASSDFPASEAAVLQPLTGDWALKGDGTALGLLRTDAASGLRMESGSTLITLTSESYHDATVTFGATFGAAPIITVSTVFSSIFLVGTVVSVSTTQAVVRVMRPDGTALSATDVPLHWLAIGAA